MQTSPDTFSYPSGDWLQAGWVTRSCPPATAGIVDWQLTTTINIHPACHAQIPETETNWAALFSDLTYVGVAFQEGALVAESLATKQFAEGFAVFIVTFTLCYDVWRTRLQLSARFHARDIAHKLLDILQMLFVAAAALHLGTLEQFQDLSTGYSLGFAVAMTGLSMLAMVRGLELLMWSPLLASQGMGEQMVRREVLPLVLNLVGVYVSLPSSGFEWYVPLGVWTAVIAAVRFDMFIRIYFGQHLPRVYVGRLGRKYSVPSKLFDSRLLVSSPPIVGPKQMNGRRTCRSQGATST
jgi:hypothetical protein